MQVTKNTTGMVAEVSAQVDRDARDWCVVVVKGTFEARPGGELELDREQRPLLEVDEHEGDPETSAVRYEHDFALYKPQTDVLVVGEARAPEGRAVTELLVGLEVDGILKQVLVVGERRWVHSAGGLRASPPVPFVDMPLSFGRAFGGGDAPGGSSSPAAERRNLVGVGFSTSPRGARLNGAPLPNLEDPQDRIATPRDRPGPVGFGVVGRSWWPRLRHAGTYDEAWLRERRPFLPADFDPRFFQAAPEDQQHPRLGAGTRIRCHNMADDPLVEYRLPDIDLPIRAVYPDRSELLAPALDTIVLEPHAGLAMLSWRARTPLPRKASRLREIWVGAPGPGEPVDLREGRPVFARLGDATAWLAARGREAET